MSSLERLFNRATCVFVCWQLNLSSLMWRALSRALCHQSASKLGIENRRASSEIWVGQKNRELCSFPRSDRSVSSDTKTRSACSSLPKNPWLGLRNPHPNSVPSVCLHVLRKWHKSKACFIFCLCVITKTFLKRKTLSRLWSCRLWPGLDPVAARAELWDGATACPTFICLLWPRCSSAVFVTMEN